MAEKGDDFLLAVQRGEVVPFLRGDGDYRRVPASDFAGEDAPTDSWQVLAEIYDAAEREAEAGKELAQGLFSLLEGTAGEVYLGLLYLTRLALAKKGGRLPLELPFPALLAAAHRQVGRQAEALAGPLAFPNGFVKKEALADIRAWNDVVFLPCFGVNLLEGI